MIGKVSFNVGDIVTPHKGYTFGYGYNRFYHVLAIGNKFFLGRSLCTDFSPFGNGSIQLPICRFRFYRKGV